MVSLTVSLVRSFTFRNKVGYLFLNFYFTMALYLPWQMMAFASQSLSLWRSAIFESG